MYLHITNTKVYTKYTLSIHKAYTEEVQRGRFPRNSL